MKKIFLVIISLFCLIVPGNVFAEVSDSFYEGEYISGAYIVKMKDDGTGKYKQMRFFRRSSDNSPVYCLQIWEGLNTNKQLSGQIIHKDANPGILYGVDERVQLIAYYGYGYKNHTDSKWYAITQYMIWQLTSENTTLYFTDTLNGNRNDNKFKKEIDEINYLVDHHYDLPVFQGNTYNLHTNETISLFDTNGVLDKFEIMASGTLKVEKDGMNLSVTTTRGAYSQLYLQKKDYIYNSNPIVYIDDEGQNLLSPGSYQPVICVSFYLVPNGNLIIHKKDLDLNKNESQGEAILNKSSFQLLDLNNNVVSSGSVDKNGDLELTNIEYGNYILKEVSSGTGYKLNNNSLNIEINKNSTEVDFYNEVIKNKIIINLSLNGENGIKKYKGAVFTITDNKGIIYEYTTNKNGKIEDILPYGTYSVKQVSGENNYTKVDDFIIKVEEDGLTQEFNLFNDQLYANIKINILDNDTLEHIIDGDSKVLIVNKDSKKEIELSTNNGIIENKLYCGNYTIKQVSTVDGYIIDNNSYDIEILDSDIELDIKNNKIRGKVEVIKEIDYYLDDDLVNTEIDNNIDLVLYAKNDIYSNGIMINSKDSEVCVLNSNNNIINLGNYYIKDNDQLVDINITDDSTKTIKLVEKIYEYTPEEVINYDNDLVIEVPNTFNIDYSNYFCVLLIISGLYLIRRDKCEN